MEAQTKLLALERFLPLKHIILQDLDISPVSPLKLDQSAKRAVIRGRRLAK
jgi:hypothetical protein